MVKDVMGIDFEKIGDLLAEFGVAAVPVVEVVQTAAVHSHFFGQLGEAVDVVIDHQMF